MIALWMMYATLVTLFACLAALTAERALRLTKRPGRWIWTGAITFACLIPMMTTRRSRVVPQLVTATTTYVLRARDDPDFGSVAAQDPTPWVMAVMASPTLSALDRPLIAAWAAGSFVWSLMLVASAAAVTRQRRHWTASMLDSVPVLISHDLGPAVVGIIRPQIVIPAWATTLAPEQRALVLAHEREHARARDPLLLAAGALTLVAIPWNAALWYALSRLRLAVEADCDERVLHAHPDVRAYSSLLVDVTEGNLSSAMHLAALGDSRSQLAQRLTLLTARVPRHLTVRVLGAALLSVACVIVACETPQPAGIARDSRAAMRRRPDAPVLPDIQVAKTYVSAKDHPAGISSRRSRVRIPDGAANRIGRPSASDTLMRVSRKDIEEALLASGIGPDSMLTPHDIRELAKILRARRTPSRSSESVRVKNRRPSQTP